ncbi:dTMP kinase [Hylemonella gracilis]|uniref:Thymidylate kinase n=1 Tax=Hylemonella gracilis ATCC 19624 TaxID=887062 RepID=F3KNY0_9BURK|nr:dTMP kinase [Hylemonella gracilis]EGI78557.1 thymidylate kinase [Hylemonella gracilis ATCC 19624]
MSGFFVSFEGIDGAGKSTHIERLAQVLREQGHMVTLTREPGGTPLAERLRALVLAEKMDALTEALLVFAARRDHLQTVIEPALARGDAVLCDRYTDASYAYQGGGRGLDVSVLATLERWVQAKPGAAGLRQPDLTLWFDLAPELAAERLSGARAPDKFEAEPVAFFRRVAEGYARRAAEDPGRFARLDAAQSREAVWDELLRVVRGKGWLR